MTRRFVVLLLALCTPLPALAEDEMDGTDHRWEVSTFVTFPPSIGVDLTSRINPHWALSVQGGGFPFLGMKIWQINLRLQRHFWRQGAWGAFGIVSAGLLGGMNGGPNGPDPSQVKPLAGLAGGLDVLLDGGWLAAGELGILGPTFTGPLSLLPMVQLRFGKTF